MSHDYQRQDLNAEIARTKATGNGLRHWLTASHRQSSHHHGI